MRNEIESMIISRQIVKEFNDFIILLVMNHSCMHTSMLIFMKSLLKSLISPCIMLKTLLQGFMKNLTIIIVGKLIINLKLIFVLKPLLTFLGN